MSPSWRVLGFAAVLGIVVSCGSGEGAPPQEGGDDPPAGGATLLPTDARVNERLDAHAEAPQICAVGDRVQVAWMDTRHGGWTIYFNRSTDGGLTWSPTDTRIDRSAAAVPSSQWPRMVCCGDRVYIVWDDRRNGAYDVYLNWSDDGGATWQPSDVRLDQDVAGAADSYGQEIACSEEYVYVVWEDFRRAVEDIHISISDDGGQSWLVSDERLNQDEEVLAGAHNPGVCCVGRDAYVHWSREGNSLRDIVGRRTQSVGITWDPEQIVNTNPPETSWSWISRAVAPGGDLVHVVWHDNRSTGGGTTVPSDIYYNRSRDAGLTWDAPDVRLNLTVPAGGSIDNPILCAVDENVFVAWLHASLLVSHMIRARRSFDGGLTWTAAEEDVVKGPTLPTSFGVSGHVVTVCDADHVFVAWNDNRASLPSDDTYLNYAPWAGPFQKADYRLNTPAAGTTKAQEVDLCTSDGAAFVVWVDDRDGHRGIYVNVLRP